MSTGGFYHALAEMKPAFALMGFGAAMAERVGFEPTIPCGIHAFQACALNRAMRPLH